MKARALLIKRLANMGVLAKIREELETKQHVFVAVWAFVVAMMMMVPVSVRVWARVGEHRACGEVCACAAAPATDGGERQRAL